MAESGKGFNSLVRQTAMISATVTLIWCLVREISLVDTIFRTGVVYISMGILGLAASSQLVKLTILPGESTSSADPLLLQPGTTTDNERVSQ